MSNPAPTPAPAAEPRGHPGPQPVPTSVSLAQVDVGAHPMVLVTFLTPVGENSFFFDGPSAVRIGERLQQLGTAARSGLVVPHNGTPT